MYSKGERIMSLFAPAIPRLSKINVSAQAAVLPQDRGHLNLGNRLAVLALICASALFYPVRASATNYTVKAGGGGNYTTISACSAAMSASGGDTCMVYAGTYNEKPTLKAGTAGSGNWDQTHANVVTVNPGDTVYVQGFTMASYSTISGFYITDPSSPASTTCVTIPANTTDFSILSNTMYACGNGTYMVGEPWNTSGTGYGHIASNTMSYGCSTSSAPNVCEAIILNGSYHLVENNTISHMYKAVETYGSYNVIRNNTFANFTTSDCGSNSDNCHLDFIFTEPSGVTLPSAYMVIEGNTETSSLGSSAGGYNNHAHLIQGPCAGCTNVIIRFNTMAHVSTYSLIDNNDSSSSGPFFYYVKSYNNTIVDFDNQNEGNTEVFEYAPNGAEINNIYYYPETITEAPYYVDSTSGTGFEAGSNMAWCTGTCTFQARSGSGSFTSDATGNQVVNPLFVSYSANNFALSSSSPARMAGTNLTTVASGDSGSGTSLVVSDVSFFQAGSGIVQPDWIRIGASTTVQIASINYSTNTITLANSVSRSAGNPVYLYKNSTGTVVLLNATPDMGANQYGQAPTPPVGNSVSK